MAERVGVRTAAQMLGVHENTVRAWHAQGILVGRPLRDDGTFLRFDPADIEALIRRLERRTRVTRQADIDELVNDVDHWLRMNHTHTPSSACSTCAFRSQSLAEVIRRWDEHG